MLDHTPALVDQPEAVIGHACGIEHLLDMGIVNDTNMEISLLGIDLIGIRTTKVTASLETWLAYRFICG